MKTMNKYELLEFLRTHPLNRGFVGVKKVNDAMDLHFGIQASSHVVLTEQACTPQYINLALERVQDELNREFLRLAGYDVSFTLKAKIQELIAKLRYELPYRYDIEETLRNLMALVDQIPALEKTDAK
jgi:hypothetical protein